MKAGPHVDNLGARTVRIGTGAFTTEDETVTSADETTTDLSASFKAYDVRGIVGETITAEIVEAVGAAFVDVLELAGQTVLVGGDMRPSSPEFSQAFARGAATRGANVQLLDLISTDELYFACGSLNAAGAVFTASHNPAEYNGIKMAKAGAVPISSETGLTEIRPAGRAVPAPAASRPPATQGSIGVQDVLKDYAEYLRSLVDLSGSRPLKVVVDAGNGMAGMTTPAVLGDQLLPALPLEIVPLYFELDGSFPNHPANPLEPENLRDLQGRRRRARRGHRPGVRRRRGPLLCDRRKGRAGLPVGRHRAGGTPRNCPGQGRRRGDARRSSTT